MADDLQRLLKQQKNEMLETRSKCDQEYSERKKALHVEKG